MTGALKLDDAAAGEATAGRVLTVISARADAELDGA
jgi:hypothetical protein